MGTGESLAMKQSDTIALLTKQVEYFWSQPTHDVSLVFVASGGACSYVEEAIHILHQTTFDVCKKLQDKVDALEAQVNLLKREQHTVKETLASLLAVISSRMEALGSALLPRSPTIWKKLWWRMIHRSNYVLKPWRIGSLPRKLATSTVY
jgi:hypothetical protein